MEKISKIINYLKSGEKTKIDTTDWKEFMVKDLLKIYSISGKDSSNFNENGFTPLIIAKKDMNGIGQFIKSGKKLFQKGKITLVKTGDGGAGLSFFQGESDFYATASVMILDENNLNYKFTLNKNIALFLITTMNKRFKKLFSHSNSINNDKYNSLSIYLPSKNNQPDWEYMDKFIENLRNKLHLNQKFYPRN